MTKSEVRSRPEVQNSVLGCRTSNFIRHFPLVLLFSLLALYVTAYLAEFLASPIGRFPMLDAGEHLALARQIAEGTLPAEPFYRAMLYPGLLSLFVRSGAAPDALPIVAGVLGGLFQLGSTLCVYQLARRAWASERAGILAAALFGFNPVAIYFAAEPLDATLGLFLFLAGLNFLLGNLNPLSFPTFAAGVALWSLAMLTRPHYAIVLAGLPFLLLVQFWRTPKRLISALVTFFIVAGAFLGAVGLWQKRCCGQFRIMPAQGAYNLWAGNRPGANGRYLEQQISLPASALENGQNPARAEAEVLYRRETGDTGPLIPDRVNAYWKSKTLAAIRAQPLAWLGLMARKVYYLFNDFEQYNNKTFAIQQALSPMLRFNPLSWGITLVLCAAGLTWAAILRYRCAGALFAISVAALYGAGVLLFFVGDRFRLPLLPFLCVGAGAWGLATSKPVRTRSTASPFSCRIRDAVERVLTSLESPRAFTFAIIVVSFLASTLTFSRAWGVHDLSPAVEDYAWLSITAGKAGQDLAGLRWARRALELRPNHPSALARAVTSFYNLKLQGTLPEREFPDETWACQVNRVARIPQPTPGVRLVQAVALWKTNQSQAARNLLRSLASSSSSDDALGVLLLTGLAEPSDEARARDLAHSTHSFYLLVALARRETAASLLVPETRHETVSQAAPFVQNIFPPG